MYRLSVTVIYKTAHGHHFLFFYLTYESSVGLQAHGSAFSHTAGSGQSRGLAVVLEVGEPGSERHKTRTNTTRKKRARS